MFINLYTTGHFASTSSKDRVVSNLNKLTEDPTGEVKIHLGSPSNTQIKLKGFQYGEKFGHSLCSVDINGDGYDDLVVGAPLHSYNNNVSEYNVIYKAGITQTLKCVYVSVI